MAKRKPKKRVIVAMDEANSRIVIPGMLWSARNLYESAMTVFPSDLRLSAGITGSSIMISAHCAELLLKYKLDREKRPVPTGPCAHDLNFLFKRLSDQSRNDIEREFEKLLSESPKPLELDWKTVETIFCKMHNAFEACRYLVQVEFSGTHSRSSEPFMFEALSIWLAALSVCKTTSIYESLIENSPRSDESVDNKYGEFKDKLFHSWTLPNS